MFKKFLGLAALSSIILAMASPVDAQNRRDNDRRVQGEWEHLGCMNIGRRADRDVLELSRRDGRFSAISLLAVGNDVEIVDLRVVYGNGRPDDIRVRSRLGEGDKTRPLDLEGRDRFIDRIELESKINRRGGGKGTASICVSGLIRDARPVVARGGWEELGCVGVNFDRDRDIIPVGRREGRFKAISLRAFGNDIDIDRVRVVYGNGRPDELRVRNLLRAGDQTRPLDLEGQRRAIERVEIVSRQDPKGILKGVIKGAIKGKGQIGKARICVYGLEDESVRDRRSR